MKKEESIPEHRSRKLGELIDELKAKDLRVNGELYLDSVFECLIDLGYCVRMVPLEGYLCWGEPGIMSEALYWQETFCGRQIPRRGRFPGIENTNDQRGV